MKRLLWAFAMMMMISLLSFSKNAPVNAWIRINQLGYTTAGLKTAVLCLEENNRVHSFELIDSSTGKTVLTRTAGKAFGIYGPFKQTYRLDFSSYKKPGKYFLKAGDASSPVFRIGDDVYDGAADFCLRYMRQQRCGFNPFLGDSCHTNDGYVLYGEKAGIKDSTHIDATGGWHDASDYLQYVTTSANATYHLLAAYRDFPDVFGDHKMANGLNGINGTPDVLDEAKWGLEWLMKMHPQDEWMFNQVADDRDHMGMRIPKEDNLYGRGFERPVYFVSGEPQQRGKFMNDTRGTSSTAGKMAAAFALGSLVYWDIDAPYQEVLTEKAMSAYTYGFKKMGKTQTASVKSPYIYAEDNWKDDMELSSAMMYAVQRKVIKGYDTVLKLADPLPSKPFIEFAIKLSDEEPITSWLGTDTAKHYQWYPFINLGHYELAKQLKAQRRKTVTSYYRKGIEKVWDKAKQNAFCRGVPFIWCSNNLTTSFAIQCYWYRELTGDNTFNELEQANFDWLFGCNPWGTSMVYGLPSWGDTPVDPHSAFTHLKNYPIDGGLVDGPVYTSIYKNLIGIKLYEPDEYALFNQSNLAVYHDDYGDYSTNEPTMDGTASLVYLLAAKQSETVRLKR